MSDNKPKRFFDPLFSWTSQPTLTEEVVKEAVLDAEADRGLYSKYASSNIKHYKVSHLQDYYDAYLNEDLIREMVDDLIESALGNGHHTIAQKVSEKNKLNKVKTCVDEYGRHFHLDDFMPNIARNALIAGFCPVETVIAKGEDYKDFSKCKLKIIRPDTIDPRSGKGIVADTSTFPPKILKVYQKVGTKEEVITAGGDKSIAWYVYGQLGNDVRGVSFVRGILTLLNTLNDATADVQKILKRYIAPIGVWKGEQATTVLKDAVVNREAGEDIFLGNLTPEEMASGVVEFHTIDPRVPFWDYLEYLDRRIWNYSRASNMYYMRNATNASQEILGAIIRRHVTSIQRFVRRGMENYWFRPLTDRFIGGENRYDEIEFRWGVERTQVEDIQLEGFLAAGIRYNYVPKKLYYKILEQLGVKIDLSDEELEELEKEPLVIRQPPGKSLVQSPKAQVSPGGDKPEQTKEPHYTEHRIFYFKQCMDCGNPVQQSVVWEKESDGLNYYAWFCDECLNDWIKRREKAGDKIMSIKPVKGGKVNPDFASFYSGYEAMPRQEQSLPLFPRMSFVGRIEGDFVDKQHRYPDRNPIKTHSEHQNSNSLLSPENYEIIKEAMPNLRNMGLGSKPLMKFEGQSTSTSKISGIIKDLSHEYPNKNAISNPEKDEEETEQ